MEEEVAGVEEVEVEVGFYQVNSFCNYFVKTYGQANTRMSSWFVSMFLKMHRRLVKSVFHTLISVISIASYK